MGVAERDYSRRSQPAASSGGMMPQVTPVVKWILFINVAVYFLDLLVIPVISGIRVQGPQDGWLYQWGAFRMQEALYQGQVWRFLTFQFLHGSLGHILFNMLALYFFAPWMERWWGSQKFLVFYLLCGGAGAAFFSLLVFLGALPAGNFWASLVGASAGIYGILIGVAKIAPHLRVQLLFPPIELSMKQLAIGLLGIAVVSVFFQIGGNSGGEAGHLGGAILGFFLMRYPKLLNSWNTRNIPQSQFRDSSSVAKRHPHNHLLVTENQIVDSILEKISKDGFQSLSEKERAILRKAAERQESEE